MDPREQPLFLVGAAIAAISWFTFMGVLFASGGVMGSRQFAAIVRLARGEHGKGRRLVMIFSLLGTVIGACVLFMGVGASDRAREERCASRCRSEGYSGGVIGAAEEEANYGHVACRCDGPGGRALELRADDL